MAKDTQSFSVETNNRTKHRVPRGKGTELPYGFRVEDLQKGLNALAYADGSADVFHKALNLNHSVKYCVSKALRTIGLLTDNFEKTSHGKNFVDSPSSHNKIFMSWYLVMNLMRLSSRLAQLTQGCRVRPI